MQTGSWNCYAWFESVSSHMKARLTASKTTMDLGCLLVPVLPIQE